MFEAGALSKGITENRVCTFLVDLAVRDIDKGSPLAQINHSTFSKKDTLKLVKTIGKSVSEEGLDEDVIDRIFDAMWPEFQKTVKDIMATEEEVTEPTRSDEDVLNEILERVIRIDHLGRAKRHRDYIPAHSAEMIFDMLVNNECDRAEIEGTLRGLVPESWLERKLGD